jgi:hypothetical protein
LIKGVAGYALDSRVIAIKRAVLQSTGTPLFKTTHDALYKWYGAWQNIEGTPAYYLLDAQSGQITLHPTPAEVNTLRLIVYRLPLAEMSLSSPSAEPEINRRHTRTLINGVLALAYEKAGTGTLNPDAAKIYRELWGKGLDDIRREAMVNGSATYSLNDLMGVI